MTTESEPPGPIQGNDSAYHGIRPAELPPDVQEQLAAVTRSQGRIHGLLDAFLSVSTGLDLESTLRRIVRAAVELVDARYGALGVLSSRGGLAAFIHVGIDEDTAAAMDHLPRGEGVLGQLITDPRPLRIADLRRHPASVGFPADHPPMTTFLGVPVLVRGQAFGNLYMTEKRLGEFTLEDEAVLTALAGAAGIAIDNARLYEDAERRRRWLAAVAHVRAALLSGSALDSVLALITERTAALTGADATVILSRPDADHTRYDVRAAHPSSVLEGTPTIAHDALRILRVAESPVSLDLTGSPAGDPDRVPWGPAVAVRLLGDDAQSMVLMAVRAAGRPPFEDVLTTPLTDFAEQAGLALEMAAQQRLARRLTSTRTATGSPPTCTTTSSNGSSQRD